MSNGKRARYTVEFKIEAVRMVRGGQERRGGVAGAGDGRSDAA